MMQRMNSLSARLLDSMLAKATAKACPSPWYTYGACVNNTQKVTEHYYLSSDGLCLGPYTYTYSDYCN
jgi:hypothetical protein